MSGSVAPQVLDPQAEHRRDLIAEFFEKQLWQFISIDEWLDGNPFPAKGEAR